MNTTPPARLKPGVKADHLPQPFESESPERKEHWIRGKALIFWDSKYPDKKLDAIDTDQITPAKDCVSESLESLDQKWKEGTFRYLMPNFKERVAGGGRGGGAGGRVWMG